MKNIGLISNNKNPKAINIAKEIYDYLKNKGITPVLLEHDSMPAQYKLPAHPLDRFSREIDVLISVGGDGTFLRAARYSFEKQVPVMGVNAGKLGFLAETDIKDSFKSIDILLSGGYLIEERMLLEFEIIRKNGTIKSSNDFVALNELSVNRSSSGKILDLKVIIKRPADKIEHKKPG